MKTDIHNTLSRLDQAIYKIPGETEKADQDLKKIEELAASDDV